MIRAVVDANVWASALINPDGPPGHLIRRMIDRTFDVVMSPDIMVELRRTLAYERVREGICLSDDDLELWLAAVEVVAVGVRPSFRVRAVVADPDDDVYLEAAMEGRAEYVVSGDRHLLELEEYEGVRILRPAEFLELLDGT